MSHRASAIITIIIMLFCLAPARAQDDGASPFGVIEAFWLPDAACAIGVGWERIIFDWAQHQPTSPDDWNTLNVDERWLTAAQACDREVVAVVKHTPTWATDGIVSAGLPRGLYLPVDDADNLWAAFMRRLAAYYAPLGVNRFIIWNEPDIPLGSYGFEFDGTLEDYAQLVKVAYLAATAVNPNAQIHIAGTTYWYDINNDRPLYVGRLLDVLAADPDAAAHGYYFDALTVHVYFRTETVYDITRANRAALERHGMGAKAVWIVETNASPNLDPAWRVERPNWQITLEQQSAFLTQAAALGLAAGAERIAAYKFFDWNLAPGAESFGLIRADESPRPAYATWGMVIALFSDVVGATLARTPTVDAVLLRHIDGRQTLVAWATTAEPAVLQVGATQPATLRDALGGAVQVAPFEDQIMLALAGAICPPVDGCAVGGQPILLTVISGMGQVQVITNGGDHIPLNFGMAEAAPS